MSRRAAFASQLTPAEGTQTPAPPLTTVSPSGPSGSSASSPHPPTPSKNSRATRGKAQQRTPARNGRQTQAQVKVQSQPLSSRQEAANLHALAKAAADNAEEEEGQGSNTCFICAEPVQYWALGSCNHRTCHTCSIRLRALYKKRECTFCKTECDSVIFTESESKAFEEYDAEATPFSDTKLGILFETRVQLEDTLSLLRFNCPSRPTSSDSPTSSTPDSSDAASSQTSSDPCPQILTGWSDLKRHVRAAHHSTLCDLCCSNKKIFAHEHELFSLPHSAPPGRHGQAAKRESELDAHLEKQHAMCGFCKRWFYDSDGLYKHCREMHEECFVCVRLGVRHQYHLNYDRLEQHFKDAHFLCPHPECLAQKFVVFESELDLQAHALSEHGVGSFGSGGTDQKSRKEARRIETNFVYSTGATERGGGGANGRGGRSGRNENAAASFVDPPPRQALGERSVPGLGSGGGASRSRTGFGGQLTNESSSNASGRNTPSQGTTRDSETLAQHAGLMKRVQDAVGGNEGRIAAFRFAVRSYRGNEMSASDLVDQLFNIFDQRVDEAGSLIRGVAELFDEPEKRQAVLNAWNESRNEQNQFPSLAPLAPTLNGIPTSANPTSGRALAAQHRTQRPSTTWDRVERAATSTGPAPIQPRSNPFPALMSASNAKNVVGLRNSGVQKKRAVGGSTPWSASGSSGASAPATSSFPGLTPSSAPVTRQPSPSSFPSLGISRPASSSSGVAASGSRQAPPRATSGLEFPSLPSSSAASEARARMRAALQKPGMSRTITDEGITPPGEREAWSFGEGAGGNNGQGKKKGKGRQKVVLMSGGLASGL